MIFPRCGSYTVLTPSKSTSGVNPDERLQRSTLGSLYGHALVAIKEGQESPSTRLLASSTYWYSGLKDTVDMMPPDPF